MCITWHECYTLVSSVDTITNVAGFMPTQPSDMAMSNNSMVTPHEIPDSTQYSGFAKRLKAFAFDYLIIVGYIIVLAVATMAVIKTAGFMGLSLRWPENLFLADLMAFVTLILPVALYFTLQESSPKQAFVHSLVKLLPWQITHTCIFQIGGFTFTPVEPSPLVITGFILVYLLVGVYVASALVSKRHRTPYDWVAGSYHMWEFYTIGKTTNTKENTTPGW
jgi:uncharacterized RDD family membrane protein YckC